MEETNQRWIEHLSRTIPIIPTSLSIVLGFAFLVVYLALMLFRELQSSEFNNLYFIQILLFCTLLTYLLIFNKYILGQINIILRELKFLLKNEIYLKEWNEIINKIVYNDKEFYIITLIIISAFLIINYIKNIYFVDIILNIYNYILFIFMLYLISLSVWLILKILLILSTLASKPYRYIIEIDLFNADRMGGLSAIRNSIIKILSYYSIGISLTILSYADPNLEAIVYEVAALVLLLLVGVILLIRAMQNLQQPFILRITKDIEEINLEYQNQYKRLNRIISDPNEKDDALTSVTKRIEALNRERSEREKLLVENKNKYNYSSIIISLISFITPIIALFEKMNGFGISKYILEIFKL